MPDRTWIALAIFLLTYAVLGFGSLPPLLIDRTGAALIGATAMVAFGVLAPDEAVRAIDFQTLALLFGMMIVVAHLRLAGFFGWLADRVLARATGPAAAVALLVLVSGAASALFVNDTACILLTPVALAIAEGFGLSAVPFLLAVAMGSNAGSVATVVGNPQNMLVASFSGIRYTKFVTVMLPVALMALAAVTLALLLAFRRQLVSPRLGNAAGAMLAPLDIPQLRKTLIISGLLLVALLVGVNPALAALSAASCLLISRRIAPSQVYDRVDWGLLAMFAGLFIVVAGIEKVGLTSAWLARLPDAAHDSPWAFVGVTAVLSNLVSNVPAVLVLKSWVIGLPNEHEAGWLLLAMASTLAGNLTIVGSVANLIVLEQARGRARIGFWTYARIGVPVTLLLLPLATAWVIWMRP
jgi:Na+/H+ antiporter NhaD/arsenite permease-like protein